MNQSLLTRLFKSFEGDPSSSVIKVAYSIIEEEKKKGHHGLAERLTNILQETLAKNKQDSPTLKVTREGDFKMPVDRRYRLKLAKHVDHNSLRHHMVASPQVDKKIDRIVKEYVGKERLAHFGLKPRKKILFYGSSGNGKSMAAERIAWDLGLPFYKVRFDNIMSSYLGESAANLQSLFDSIQDYPCVLLLDEFDIIGKQRSNAANDVGEMNRIVNILLGLLEEYDGQGILIATTNLEGMIDHALFRRFDDFIEMPKPSEKEIFSLLEMSFSALHLSPAIDLQKYAYQVTGMSYAIVVKIANDAAKKAVINSNKQIEPEDLDKSIEENMALSK